MMMTMMMMMMMIMMLMMMIMMMMMMSSITYYDEINGDDDIDDYDEIDDDDYPLIFQIYFFFSYNLNMPQLFPFCQIFFFKPRIFCSSTYRLFSKLRKNH